MMNRLIPSLGSRPHMTSWASVSAMQASVAGLVGVAGLILAIKRDCIFGTLSCLSGYPAERTVSEEELPGLQNHGNNCFLNVILQALAACSDFHSYIQEVVEESNLLAFKERSEWLPLAEALDALLEELRVLNAKKIVLDPKKVIDEMSYHSPSFSLRNQQDATETLFLLISFIREEFSGCYRGLGSTVGITSESTSRILDPQLANEPSEKEKWQQHHLGPFDGIISSTTSCLNCSSQLSLDFEFFHTLILCPRKSSHTHILRGCTLFDCIRDYALGRREEWRRCNICWHAAAAPYLSQTGASEEAVDKVKSCTQGDSCECPSLPDLDRYPWLSPFHRIIRRNNIARSPKILSLQLNRAVAVESGEIYKLEGHIAFPLVLDLSVLVTSGYGINMHKDLTIGPWLKEEESHLRPTMVFNSGIIKMVATIPDEPRPYMQKQPLEKTDGCSESDDKKLQYLITKTEITDPDNVYRLVSVVEHFGRVEDGHFVVYRNVRTNPPEGSQSTNPGQVRSRWFRISDSEVRRVSESDVLRAHACNLLYEKVPE